MVNYKLRKSDEAAAKTKGKTKAKGQRKVTQGANQKPVNSSARQPTGVFAQGIIDGINDLTEALQGKGKRKLTYREVRVINPPPTMNCKAITQLRKKLNISQQVLALLLNVSVQTVQAWEQSRNIPSGAALRLMQIVKENPDIFLHVKAR